MTLVVDCVCSFRSRSNSTDPVGGSIELHVIVSAPPCAIVLPSTDELTVTRPVPEPPTVIGALACIVPPDSVTHFNTAVIVDERGGVRATPLILVLFAFADVKALLSGLEMTQDCIPLVTQPTVDVAPTAAEFGEETMTIDGCVICTAHCALPV